MRRARGGPHTCPVSVSSRVSGAGHMRPTRGPSESHRNNKISACELPRPQNNAMEHRRSELRGGITREQNVAVAPDTYRAPQTLTCSTNRRRTTQTDAPPPNRSGASWPRRRVCGESGSGESSRRRPRRRHANRGQWRPARLSVLAEVSLEGSREPREVFHLGDQLLVEQQLREHLILWAEDLVELLGELGRGLGNVGAAILVDVAIGRRGRLLEDEVGLDVGARGGQLDQVGEAVHHGLERLGLFEMLRRHHEHRLGRVDLEPALQVLRVHGAPDERRVLHHRVEPGLLEAVDAEARRGVLPVLALAVLEPLDLRGHLVGELLVEVLREALGIERLLVLVAAVPHGDRRQPLLGGDSVLVDVFHRRDAIVAIGARPRELAADLDLPLHVERRHEPRDGLAQQDDNLGRRQQLRGALRRLGVVEVRGRYLATHLVALALAQPVAAAVEALLVDERPLAEVVVP
mmetsp:Transcript_13893/g.41233  ORF Transcript_13893/g.41233 Transcript_13893/m.41233 type:complete len:463 (-) Transcript_13893:1056-2444(-)